MYIYYPSQNPSQIKGNQAFIYFHMYKKDSYLERSFRSLLELKIKYCPTEL